MTHTPYYYHLFDRGWRPWLNGWVDIDQEILTVPLLTADKSKWIGYQRYRWNTTKRRGNEDGRHQRYYTHVQEQYKGMAAYGWDNCFGHGPLFVTEGIFDALKVTNNWWDCIATTTNQPTKQFRQWFNMITGGRRTIAIMDDGEPRQRWLNWCDEAYYTPDPYHDLGDMSIYDVRTYLENLIREPLLYGVVNRNV